MFPCSDRCMLQLCLSQKRFHIVLQPFRIPWQNATVWVRSIFSIFSQQGKHEGGPVSTSNHCLHKFQTLVQILQLLNCFRRPMLAFEGMYTERTQRRLEHSVEHYIRQYKMVWLYRRMIVIRSLYRSVFITF